MNTNKSQLTRLGEAWDAYRAEQQSVQVIVSAPKSASRLVRMLRWLTPNGGTLLIVAILLMTQSLWARPQAAPSAPGPSATTVNYQGRLADNAGAPLDGSYAMRFSLYDAATDGALIWGPEIHDAVPVSDGLFSVGLGSQTAGGIPTSAWNGDRYLEITVGGETLSPRELIRSVPIAGMALTVPDGSITQEKLGKQPYYFHGALATPSEWMADVVFNGNYARFCQTIGRTYSRVEELQAHYTIQRGNGCFYDGWYYVGSRQSANDIHMWGNGTPDDSYNVWQYHGSSYSVCNYDWWTYERSAIIWCE
ncbi:MAG TPA: hypothetical protein PKH77_00765 [Anaerolineae bacterium]|nr:hypothetical protein [Anaerolineae bacterium]